MKEELTPEQAKRLLKAIFAEEKDPNEMTADELNDIADENYPETIIDKVGYAEYVLTHDLEYIGKAINRLSRLSRLLLVADKSGGLPPIITHNELRMALEHLLRVRGGINEISDMLMEVYEETKLEGTHEDRICD
jgi:hypothetical protein